MCIVEADAVVAGVPDAVAALAERRRGGPPDHARVGAERHLRHRARPRRGRPRPAQPGRDSRLGMTQSEKAEAFRALHEGEPFVIPNPWDAGSARMFEALGFKALATTQLRLRVHARAARRRRHARRGRRPRARWLGPATSLPVSVDLENGYGPAPEEAARAITRVAEAGAVGGSIEDWDADGRRCTSSSTRSSGWRRPSRRRGRSTSRSRSPHAPRTTSAEPRPRRHDRPAAGLRASRRRRAVRARAAQRRRGPRRLLGGVAPGQRARATRACRWPRSSTRAGSASASAAR